MVSTRAARRLESVERRIADLPASARDLPDPQLRPVFASVVPEMIVPYADPEAVRLANLDRGNAMAHHRVGLALPAGMRGRKPK